MDRATDTGQVVRAFEGRLPVRYIPEPRRGYGYARNRGLAEARGEFIYFLDDDCVPAPDWADVLWNVLDSRQCRPGWRISRSRPEGVWLRAWNIFQPTARCCRRPSKPVPRGICPHPT